MTYGIGGARKDGNDFDLKLSPGCSLGHTPEDLATGGSFTRVEPPGDWTSSGDRG